MRISNCLKNQSGIILVTVILLTIILSVVAVGIMSVNVSQVTSAQSVIDSIKAEQLATGTFFQRHQQEVQTDGCASCPTPGDCTSCPDPTNETLDGKTFTVNVTYTNDDSGPNGSDPVNVSVVY